MKTVIGKGQNKSNVILMKDMGPCQMGFCEYEGKQKLVMRTASKSKFEVMNLTDFSSNRCWDHLCALEVTLITEPVTVTFIP